MAYQGLNKNVRRILAPYPVAFGTYLEVNGNTSYMASELMQRRKDLGLTQKELGEKLGVDRNTIARWENGKIKFPPVLVDLALESLENKYKKEIRKLARANGTGGESDYDASGFPSWLESPVLTTLKNKPKKEIRKRAKSDYDASALGSWLKSPVIESDTNESDVVSSASDNDNEELLTTVVIAKRIGLSKKSVTDYINKGILPTIQPKGARTPHFVKESDYPAFELYYRNLTGKM